MRRWNDAYPDELFHYGVKRRSGRYPFGSGNRPYQSVKGSGKLIGKAKSVISRSKNKKAEDKKKAVEDERQRHESDRERVLKKGSASEVLKYQGELSNKELQDAATRLRLENEIKGYAKKEVQTNMQKIDKAMKNLKMVSDWTKIGTEMYNQMADAYNSTEEGRRKPLHRIGS